MTSWKRVMVLGTVAAVIFCGMVVPGGLTYKIPAMVSVAAAGVAIYRVAFGPKDLYAAIGWSNA